MDDLPARRFLVERRADRVRQRQLALAASPRAEISGCSTGRCRGPAPRTLRGRAHWRRRGRHSNRRDRRRARRRGRPDRRRSSPCRGSCCGRDRAAPARRRAARSCRTASGATLAFADRSRPTTTPPRRRRRRPPIAVRRARRAAARRRSVKRKTSPRVPPRLLRRGRLRKQRAERSRRSDDIAERPKMFEVRAGWLAHGSCFTLPFGTVCTMP